MKFFKGEHPMPQVPPDPPLSVVEPLDAFLPPPEDWRESIWYRILNWFHWRFQGVVIIIPGVFASGAFRHSSREHHDDDAPSSGN